MAVSTGEQIWGLIDIPPATFDTIPETLDAASKRDILSRLGTAVTVAAWFERTGHGPGA
ncbi:hypothetical protein [Streptomyces cyaneofuscatus]|uniref:hypothetical protein n=1 Tax=Streptomyces cyaneofuscatus TaxID=66883 RepID=UPI00381DCC05